MTIQRLGIDYSLARPDPKAIKAAGYEAVFRYLSFSPHKNLTKAEADALHAAGLTIYLVWETTAARAAQGRLAGITDATEANKQADALGYPKDAPIFYAVDFDATPTQVRTYFQGAKSVGGRPVGDYGGIKITNGALTPWHWQTQAWSAHEVSPRAHIFQRTGHTHRITGVSNSDWDENVLIKPVPGWAPAPQPAPEPAPKPVPPLRVVQWNVQRGRLRGVLVELTALADRADILILQEVAGYHRQLRLLKGWTIAVACDDVAILVRDGTHIDSTATVRVTQHGWWTVRGHKTGPKFAACAVVRGVLFVSEHAAPTVQTAWQRLRSPRRWVSYKEMMASQARVVHGHVRAVVALDSNVDAKSDDAQRRANWPLATFTALGMTRYTPDAPTHGSRTIDYLFAKGVQVGHVTTLKKLGSDHRPVYYEVTP